MIEKQEFRKMLIEAILKGIVIGMVLMMLLHWATTAVFTLLQSAEPLMELDHPPGLYAPPGD